MREDGGEAVGAGDVCFVGKVYVWLWVLGCGVGWMSEDSEGWFGFRWDDGGGDADVLRYVVDLGSGDDGQSLMRFAGSSSASGERDRFIFIENYFLVCF